MITVGTRVVLAANVPSIEEISASAYYPELGKVVSIGRDHVIEHAGRVEIEVSVVSCVREHKLVLVTKPQTFILDALEGDPGDDQHLLLDAAYESVTNVDALALIGREYELVGEYERAPVAVYAPQESTWVAGPGITDLQVYADAGLLLSGGIRVYGVHELEDNHRLVAPLRPMFYIDGPKFTMTLGKGPDGYESRWEVKSPSPTQFTTPNTLVGDVVNHISLLLRRIDRQGPYETANYYQISVEATGVDFNLRSLDRFEGGKLWYL